MSKEEDELSDSRIEEITERAILDADVDFCSPSEYTTREREIYLCAFRNRVARLNGK